jgi:Winged helix DNA-binding domain
MRTISTDERRARLGVRHLLAAPARSVEGVAAKLVGIHSTDPATVYLSAWARTGSFKPGDLEDALYERRSLVRLLGMRRTLFVVPRGFASVLHLAAGHTYARAERVRLIRMLEDAGIVAAGKAPRWLKRVEANTLEALTGRGEATARELTRDVPELANKISFGEGKTWAGTMGVSTRVLYLLTMEGRVVRTRPLGGWMSGQYRWARIEDWLGEPIPELERAEACAELLRGYLRAFGPVTMTDVRWWTGWTAKLAKQSLDTIGAVEVSLDDGSMGYLLERDRQRVDEPDPWLALLPSLDTTIMGWKDRDWYLGARGAELFDRAGNAGPSVWADGRVVGAWIQGPDGEIDVGYLERVDARTRKRIDAERARLRDWLGEVRIKPRFPTPFHLELASGTPTRTRR